MKYSERRRDLIEHLGLDEDIGCDNCDFTGETLAMVCNGGMPYEIIISCPDCGSGEPIER